MKACVAISVFLFTAACLLAQSADPAPNTPNAPIPRITFDLSFPGADPAHYSLAVDQSGRASYRSEQATEAASDPYMVEFQVSSATRNAIFELARQVDYFNGKFDYKHGRIANTGIKTLTYEEGPQTVSFANPVNGKKFQTSFNYSQNPTIQRLTAIFQKISSTLEYGNRLTYLHRHDRIGLNDQLVRMQDAQKAGDLLELHADSEILAAIANDHAVMNIARERARKLLLLAQAESTNASAR